MFEQETGLYYAKARFLDPKLGRFLTQDSFLGDIDEPPSLHRYLYANDNPARFIDPTGHAAGDLLDPRTYFGGANERAGAAAGAKSAYFDNAADIGDSVGAWGKGAGKAALGLAKGTAGLVVGAASAQAEAIAGAAEYAVTGNPNRLHELESEVKGGAGAAWQEIKATARVAKEAYSNPSLALDAATELGIKGTSEVVGGATFETAMLVAPLAKGAPVAGVVQEGRRAAVTAAVQESRAARATSRFSEYAARTAPIEEGAAGRAAEQAAIRARVTSNLQASAASRTPQSVDRFARYAGLDEVLGLTRDLPAAVVAKLEGAGGSFIGRNAGSSLGARDAVAQLAQSMRSVKPSFSFMKHAEGDAMIQGLQAGLSGRARMFISEAPCAAFCATTLGKGGIRRMMKVMGLDDLEVMWPGNAKGTPFTPLK